MGIKYLVNSRSQTLLNLTRSNLLELSIHSQTLFDFRPEKVLIN